MKIIQLEEVNSTNEYLKELVHTEKVQEWTVVYALDQYKGRGISSNNWESEPGKNITCSIYLSPSFIKPADQFILSKAISLGIADYLSQHVDRISIKWPNDIYYSDQKIAGILIENTLRGEEFIHSITGIGLNLNQDHFISDAPNPVSLKQITSQNYDVSRELNLLLHHVQKRYNGIKGPKRKQINSEYLQKLYRINEWHIFLKDGIPFSGKIRGVSPYGFLIIETKEGEKNEYDLKDIEFVI